MFLTGREGDGTVEDVGGFDAGHALPFLVAEVGHGGGAFAPWVPDDGGGGVFFGGGEGAAEDGVDEVDGRGGVEVGMVGGLREGEGAGLNFAAVGVGVVEVSSAVEAADLDALRESDMEVGMEGFFEAEGRGAGVGDDELEVERAADAEAVGKVEVVGPPAAGGVVAVGGEGDGDGGVGVEDDGVELPGAGADKAMGWGLGVAGFSAEPGKADGDAAADGLAVLPVGAIAEEEDFLLLGGLPGGEVGAVEVENGAGGGGGDVESGEVTAAGEDLSDAGNGELAVEGFDGGGVGHVY